MSLLLSSKCKERGFSTVALFSGDNDDNERNNIHLFLTVEKHSSKHLIYIKLFCPQHKLCSTPSHFTVKQEDCLTYVRLQDSSVSGLGPEQGTVVPECCS